jgi:hypothetical protein
MNWIVAQDLPEPQKKERALFVRRTLILKD